MEQNDLEKIKLTKSQKKVLGQVLDFVDHPDDRIFILKGYAGTGKTTLMRFVIKELDERQRNYRLLASTGRAAKILANASGKSGCTSTIHSMVYTFNGLNKEYDEREEIVADAQGQLFLVFEPAKLNEENDPESIYIIDEASMVSDVATRDITQARFGSGRLLKELLDDDPRNELRAILHTRRHLAASPIFKGIPNFRPMRIQMLRAETVSELNDLLEQCRQLLKH